MIVASLVRQCTPGYKGGHLNEGIYLTRGPKGHISCTWVQCATFLTEWPGRPSCFYDRPEKHKLCRGRWDLASCQVSLNSIQRFQRSRKCLNNQKPWRPSCFSDHKKKTNTNSVEDVEIFLLVKFRWIPFRGEVENVSANQRPRRPYCFFDRPKKQKLGNGRLRSCFLSSSIKFRSAVSEVKSKMSQPIRGQGGHLVFPIGTKNTNFVEDIEIRSDEKSKMSHPNLRPSCWGRWDLAPCQVSLNSIQWFQKVEHVKS